MLEDIFRGRPDLTKGVCPPQRRTIGHLTITIGHLMDSTSSPKHHFIIILLRTWNVASQQCYSYGWEESSTG
ncbi:hypothetical protein AVEN_139246-1, partial [Araneus ventricosus]